jgi:tetratricopeptide (TPR) repeat protein
MNPSREDPQHTARLVQSGLEHFQAGRLPEAEEIFQSILQEQPRHPDALHLLGLLKHRAGQHEAAVGLIEDAIKTNPSVPAFYNNCGEAYRALQRYDLAVARFEQALAINPQYAEAHYNVGNVLQNLGRQEEAIVRYEQALVFKPNYPKAHNNLGNALRTVGRQKDAIACYQQAVNLRPDYAEAYYNLGNALQELCRHDDAVASYERAVAIKPDFAEAHNNLGNALQKLGRHERALAHHEQCLAFKPDLAEAHSNLGNALQELSRHDEALASYEQALSLAPDFAEAHYNLGISLQDLGRQAEAIASYEQALALKPDHAEARRSLTLIKPSHDQIPLLQKRLRDPSTTEEDAIHLHFALGDLFDQASSYTEAFENFQNANDLKRKTINYDARQHSALVDRLIDTYTEGFFAANTTHGSISELPVFIVGMPRSGTTLVEQIISSHPQLHGAGELDALMRIEEALARQIELTGSYPEGISSCGDSIAAEFAAAYLDELGKHSQSAARITDKMPSNFMRVGLIKILFPNAYIIHCQRNALDTCSSIYLNYIVKGHDYSFDLKELGQYYLDYERLMAHWDNVLVNQIFPVRYEDLVANQEPTSRRLVEQLGLEWDEACLDFYENKRAVKTASNLQVRKPIYKDSINRWRRYEKQLAPLVKMLERHA